MRIEYPGAIYHVLSRGDRRESIFLDDGDCHERVRMIEQSNANIWFDPFDELMANHPRGQTIYLPVLHVPPWFFGRMDTHHDRIGQISHLPINSNPNTN
jgi:hypothetical protein